MVVLEGEGETVSAEFSVKQGKNREFPRIGAESSATTPYNRLIFLSFVAKFPTRRNREIFEPNWEFEREKQGIGLGGREAVSIAVQA